MYYNSNKNKSFKVGKMVDFFKIIHKRCGNSIPKYIAKDGKEFFVFEANFAKGYVVIFYPGEEIMTIKGTPLSVCKIENCEFEFSDKGFIARQTL